MTAPSESRPDAESETHPNQGDASGGSSLLHRVLTLDFIGAAVAAVALFVGVGLLHPDFLAADRIANVLNQAAFVGILAVGVAILLAMRHVDLSVGAIFGLCGMTAAIVSQDYPVVIAILAALAVGAACGLVNGVLIQILALPSIVVTLATLQVFRGLTIAISDGRQRSGPDLDTWFPELMVKKPLGIPVTAWMLVLVTGLVTIGMSRTVEGYRIRSLGSNPEAARFAGLPTARTELLGFAGVGVLCGLGGVLALGFFASADPNGGVGFELRAIAAAIIGGNSLRGGRVTIVGAAVGAVVLSAISSALAQFEVPLIWNAFATGLAILLAISIDSLLRRSVSARRKGWRPKKGNP